jgi:acyl carrier protein
MENEILEILKETRPEFDFGEGVNFIDSGYLDSFDVITVVADLEAAFNVKINGAFIVPENFQSVSAIVNIVKNAQDAS